MPLLVDVIRAVGVRRSAMGDEVLMAEGAVSDRAILLLEGHVKISAVVGQGRVALFAVRGPGAVVGEVGVLCAVPRTATVTAVEPVAYVEVGAERLRRAVDADASLALDVIRLLRERLAEADRRHGEHLTTDTTRRVAGRLADLDGPDIPLSQAELAGLVGASLEATAKALRFLRDRGIITTRRRQIRIEDPGELRRVADDTAAVTLFR